MLIIRPVMPMLAFILVIFFSCKKSTDPAPTPTSTTPSISSIAPISDTIGAKIVVTGSNFDTNPSNDIVKVNGIIAQVVSATATQLTIVIPAGATSGTISVTVNGQTITSADTITILGPAITSFSPGIIGIGYPLTITGTAFSADISSDNVQINGASATITSANNTMIAATIPVNAVSGKISITTKGQTVTSANNLVIKKLTVTTIGGLGNSYSDGTGGTISLDNPWSITPDGHGNFYIADGERKIRKLTPAGILTTVAGTNIVGYSDGPIASAKFDDLYGIAVDSHGNIFVSEPYRHNIRKISTDGIVSTFAGDPNGTSGSADGSGIAARFNTPLNIAIDKNDNIFVVDRINYKIRKITPAGVVSTLAGSGSANFTDGTGAAAGFSSPLGICVDMNGNIMVTETENQKVRKITQAGVVTTVAGNGTKGFSDGPALSAAFYYPNSIIADQGGNFYVVDQGGSSVRMLSSDGNVYTLAGSGNAVSTDGVGYFASFNFPGAITMSAANELEVIDYGNFFIRKVIIQ